MFNDWRIPWYSIEEYVRSVQYSFQMKEKVDYLQCVTFDACLMREKAESLQIE